MKMNPVRVFLWRFLPFLVFLVLSFFLWRGLSLDPHALPSTKIGQPLPSFSLPDLFDKNKKITDKDLRGKVSLLIIWASWCESCMDEQVFLMQLKKQAVLIYGVNYKDEDNDAIKWLEEWGNPYQRVGVDKAGKLAIDLGVYGTPETFLIDKNGLIRYRHVGILDEQVWSNEFVPRIKELKGSEISP